MAKFRKKPVVIEAFQYHASESFANWPEWAKSELKHGTGFLEEGYARDSKPRHIRSMLDYLLIETLEGTMRADDGDWIIKGVKGEFYPCKPDIFNATYEEEEEATMAEQKHKWLTDESIAEMKRQGCGFELLLADLAEAKCLLKECSIRLRGLDFSGEFTPTETNALIRFRERIRTVPGVVEKVNNDHKHN